MKLKDKIIKNRVGILIFIGVLLVVTIIIGISYAYFFNIEIKNNNTISGNINTKYYTFESSGNSTLSLNKIKKLHPSYINLSRTKRKASNWTESL